jgi:hypothetical protein
MYANPHRTRYYTTMAMTSPMWRGSPAADKHLERIVKALKRQGVPASKTSVLSSIVLSTPIPTKINAHWVGQPTTVTGEISGMASGSVIEEE